MTQVVNDTDKLTFILTDWGLQRVAQALEDNTTVIMLTKIKVGDANFEYYVPTSSNPPDLKHPIEGGEFYIIEKDLLEDGLTVSLHAVIPESFSGCEIREVGIYENFNGQDKLFAISTQQPFVKPSTDLNYFIVEDYFAFLKSANLAEVYDNIYLDPDNQMITQQDFDNLMSTILFTESNLMEQINGNSRIIGLNRAQQLHDKIEENKNTYSYMASCNSYSLLLSDVTDQNSIFAYWLFDYSKKANSATSITDISGYGRSLSTNKRVNDYERVYNGFTPMLTFTPNDYFFMPQNDAITEFNSKIFSVIGALEVTSLGIAQNFSVNNYATLPSITKVNGNSYSFTFNFSLDTGNYSQIIAYMSTNYTMRTYYDADRNAIMTQLGDGTSWTQTTSFPASIGTKYTVKIVFNDDILSIGTIEGGVYQEKITAPLTSVLPANLGSLTLGGGETTLDAFADTMDLSKVSASVNGNTIYSGLTSISVNNLSFITEDESADISFSMLFSVEPLKIGMDRTLIARANYSTNSFIFEITETEQNSLRVKLFYDSSNYLTFETGMDTIPITAHALGIRYNAVEKDMVAYVGGRKLSMTKRMTGNYKHMTNPASKLYSFTYTESYDIYADSPTAPTTLYNPDGSIYEGYLWSLSDGVVFYSDDRATYRAAGNVQTDLLYCWLYNDGLYDYKVYTKTLTIESNTTLYKSDYSVYTGSDFRVVPSGSDYVIQYGTSLTEYTEDQNINPVTLYCYTFSYPMETIWANSPTEPTILYYANGDIYDESDWYVANFTVYYTHDNGIATYTNLYDLIIPMLPVTSYVINKEGKVFAPINSNIGAISVVKELIPNEKLRTLTLNLDAALGNNPCIKEY